MKISNCPSAVGSFFDLPDDLQIRVLSHCKEPTRDAVVLTCRAMPNIVRAARKMDYERGFSREGRWTAVPLPTWAELMQRGCWPHPRLSAVTKVFPILEEWKSSGLGLFYSRVVALEAEMDPSALSQDNPGLREYFFTAVAGGHIPHGFGWVRQSDEVFMLGEFNNGRLSGNGVKYRPYIDLGYIAPAIDYTGRPTRAGKPVSLPQEDDNGGVPDTDLMVEEGIFSDHELAGGGMRCFGEGHSFHEAYEGTFIRGKLSGQAWARGETGLRSFWRAEGDFTLRPMYDQIGIRGCVYTYRGRWNRKNEIISLTERGAFLWTGHTGNRPRLHGLGTIENPDGSVVSGRFDSGHMEQMFAVTCASTRPSSTIPISGEAQEQDKTAASPAANGEGADLD